MRRGFNLIEVLVAIAILAAVFVPVFSLFQSGVRTTKYTEDRLRALHIALQQIETLRHAATINRKSLDMVVREHLVAGGFRTFAVDERYQVTTSVDPDFEVREGSLRASVCKVKVTVDWKLADDPRQLVLETWVDRAYE